MTVPKDRADDRADRVRPYALTGGRTRSARELPVEAQVVRTSLGESLIDRLGHEHRQIAQLAASPVSIAEIAAHLHVHLGVARVLVGDMEAANLLAVHHYQSTKGRPDVATLEKVLDGLRAL